jgi:hypothetical protein
MTQFMAEQLQNNNIFIGMKTGERYLLSISCKNEVFEDNTKKPIYIKTSNEMGLFFINFNPSLIHP